MSNCTYKVKIKDIQNNYKVIMEDIQNKYKFKIFCTGNSYDDTEIREEIEALQDELDETEEELEQYKTIYNALPKVTGEGSNITLNNTANSVMKFKEYKGDTYQANAILPSEYTQVDYIESSGTQYIDTSVNADNKLRVVLDMQYTDLSNVNKTNCGAIRSGSPNIRYHLMTQGGKFRLYTMDGGIDLLNSDTNRHTFDLDVPNNIITVDSTQVEKISTAFDVQLNFWLFGRNSNNDSYKFYNSSKLYFCQMYYNNELVRDFIPCYRNSDNEVGLYDLANNVFYTNQGTGAFTYGSVATIPNPSYPQDIHVVSGDNTIIVSNSDNTQSQSYPINLGNIELCKIGDYQDYIYKENDNWYKHEVIKKDDTSSFSLIQKVTSTMSNDLYGYAINVPLIKRNYSDLGSVISNIFAPKILGSTGSTTDPNNVRFNQGISKHSNSGISQIVISIDKSYLTTGNVNEVIPFLDSKDFIFYFLLQTPTEVQITDSTLISQLEAIKEAESYSGQTNISQTNDDKPFILTVKALKDLSNLGTSTVSTLNTASVNRLGTPVFNQSIDPVNLEINSEDLELNNEEETIEETPEER